MKKKTTYRPPNFCDKYLRSISKAGGAYKPLRAPNQEEGARQPSGGTPVKSALDEAALQADPFVGVGLRLLPRRRGRRIWGRFPPKMVSFSPFFSISGQYNSISVALRQYQY